MTGRLSGVKTRILQQCNKALFVHCCAHSLNLALQDATRSVNVVRDTLDYVKELNNVIRASAKRYATFERIRHELVDAGSDNLKPEICSTSLRQLCPTRWTVKGKAMKSVLDNYETVLDTLEEIAGEDKGDAGCKASGLSNIFQQFKTYCGLMFGVAVFQPAEELSRLLQRSTLTADVARRAATMLIDSLQDMRNDEKFHSQWVTITQRASELKLNEPQLPKRRKPPSRFDVGVGPATTYESPENFYRRIFFEFLDCTINFLKDRFDQPSFDIYARAENLLLRAANDELSSLQPDLEVIAEHFGGDLDNSRLEVQLKMLSSVFRLATIQKAEVSSLQDVTDSLAKLGDARHMFSEVNLLLRLLLTIPVSSATAERSFSALRRLKSFTRSTMSAARLNHVAIIHIHKDYTAKVSPVDVCNMFIAGVQSRRAMFGDF